MSDCIFCKIASGKVATDFVYDDDNFFGILDNNPKAEGHTLIISKKHYKTILDLPNTLGNELQEAIKKVSLGLIKDEKAEGFNVLVNVNGSAGQLVEHFHVHVIPRKEGDGLKAIA